jgi:limonene-1,2-epoxide hydrolase
MGLQNQSGHESLHKCAKGAFKMPQNAQQIVVEFCNAWGDGAIARPDVNKIIGMFAEDGVWQLWVPAGPVFKGRAALRSEIERQCGFSSFMRCGITRIVSSGKNVVTERVDHFTMRGIRVEHALMAIYEIDADGKIAAWREYFDTADIGKQLGMAPEAVIGG